MATIETLFVMDEETQIKGLSYIFYCKGLTLAHTTLLAVWKQISKADKND